MKYFNNFRRVAQPILDYYVNSKGGSDSLTGENKQPNQRTEIETITYNFRRICPTELQEKDSKQLLINAYRGF